MPDSSETRTRSQGTDKGDKSTGPQQKPRHRNKRDGSNPRRARPAGAADGQAAGARKEAKPSVGHSKRGRGGGARRGAAASRVRGGRAGHGDKASEPAAAAAAADAAPVQPTSAADLEKLLQSVSTVVTRKRSPQSNATGSGKVRSAAASGPSRAGGAMPATSPIAIDDLFSSVHLFDSPAPAAPAQDAPAAAGAVRLGNPSETLPTVAPAALASVRHVEAQAEHTSNAVDAAAVATIAEVEVAAAVEVEATAGAEAGDPAAGVELAEIQDLFATFDEPEGEPAAPALAEPEETGANLVAEQQLEASAEPPADDQAAPDSKAAGKAPVGPTSDQPAPREPAATPTRPKSKDASRTVALRLLSEVPVSDRWKQELAPTVSQVIAPCSYSVEDMMSIGAAFIAAEAAELQQLSEAAETKLPPNPLHWPMQAVPLPLYMMAPYSVKLYTTVTSTRTPRTAVKSTPKTAPKRKPREVPAKKPAFFSDNDTARDRFNSETFADDAMEASGNVLTGFFAMPDASADMGGLDDMALEHEEDFHMPAADDDDGGDVFGQLYAQVESSQPANSAAQHWAPEHGDSHSHAAGFQALSSTEPHIQHHGMLPQTQPSAQWGMPVAAAMPPAVPPQSTANKLQQLLGKRSSSASTSVLPVQASSSAPAPLSEMPARASALPGSYSGNTYSGGRFVSPNTAGRIMAPLHARPAASMPVRGAPPGLPALGARPVMGMQPMASEYDSFRHAQMLNLSRDPSYDMGTGRVPSLGLSRDASLGLGGGPRPPLGFERGASLGAGSTGRMPSLGLGRDASLGLGRDASLGLGGSEMP